MSFLAVQLKIRQQLLNVSNLKPRRRHHGSNVCASQERLAAPCSKRYKLFCLATTCPSSNTPPGEQVERPPTWIMRQGTCEALLVSHLLSILFLTPFQRAAICPSTMKPKAAATSSNAVAIQRSPRPSPSSPLSGMRVSSTPPSSLATFW